MIEALTALTSLIYEQSALSHVATLMHTPESELLKEQCSVAHACACCEYIKETCWNMQMRQTYRKETTCRTNDRHCGSFKSIRPAVATVAGVPQRRRHCSPFLCMQNVLRPFASNHSMYKKMQAFNI